VLIAAHKNGTGGIIGGGILLVKDFLEFFFKRRFRRQVRHSPGQTTIPVTATTISALQNTVSVRTMPEAFRTLGLRTKGSHMLTHRIGFRVRGFSHAVSMAMGEAHMSVAAAPWHPGKTTDPRACKISDVRLSSPLGGNAIPNKNPHSGHLSRRPARDQHDSGIEENPRRGNHRRRR